MDNRIKIGVAATAVASATGLAVWEARRRQRHRHRLTEHDVDLTETDGEWHRITTPDGGELLVVRTGNPDGPTVVLAHCWTCSKTTWLPVARRLAAAGCDVIRWDQRGHGESVAGSEGHQIKVLGDDLATTMSQFDIRDAVLAGHSMGGMTVMQYATSHPEDFRERVRALVLVDTAAGGMDNLMIRQAKDVVGNQAVESVMRNRVIGPFMHRGTFGTWASHEHMSRAAEDYLASPASARAEFGAGFPELDLSEQISQIDKPTTIIVGINDILTPVKMARVMHEQIPEATLITLPGAGHMSPFEAPDEVAEAILYHVYQDRPSDDGTASEVESNTNGDVGDSDAQPVR